MRQRFVVGLIVLVLIATGWTTVSRNGEADAQDDTQLAGVLLLGIGMGSAIAAEYQAGQACDGSDGSRLVVVSDPARILERQVFGRQQSPVRLTITDAAGSVIGTSLLTQPSVVGPDDLGLICGFSVQLPAEPTPFYGFIVDDDPIQWRSRAELEAEVAATGTFTIPVIPADVGT